MVTDDADALRDNNGNDGSVMRNGYVKYGLAVMFCIGLMVVAFSLGAASYEPTPAGIQMEKLCEAQGWVPEIREKCNEWRSLDD